MNRVKLTISDEGGRTLCKMGTSIQESVGIEYSDKEIADALTEMAQLLNEAHEHRVQTLTEKWGAVLGAETPPGTKAMLIEAQEARHEV